MGRILDAFESLPWSSVDIPLGFRRAAARLETVLGDPGTLALARGFQDNDPCLVALTSAIHVCSARAFRVDQERWDIEGTRMSVRDDEERCVLELRAPGHRVVVRLLDEAPSRELVKRLDEALNPRSEITFTRYVG